jgi:hypothetical protein
MCFHSHFLVSWDCIIQSDSAGKTCFLLYASPDALLGAATNKGGNTWAIRLGEKVPFIFSSTRAANGLMNQVVNKVLFFYSLLFVVVLRSEGMREHTSGGEVSSSDTGT